MKIHVASDFHLEFTPNWSYTPPKADLAIIAGDITSGRHGPWNLKTYFNYPCPIITVAGNHEFYGENYSDLIGQMKGDSDDKAHFLELDSRIFKDPAGGDKVVVLGATLWTDFEVYHTAENSTEYARRAMSDYLQIRVGKTNSLLTPETTVTLHRITVQWLDELMTAFPLHKKVIVTHHAPSKRSIVHPFVGDPLSPAFASDLEWLIMKHNPALWVHGHVHSSHDYMIGKTRIVANPRGYPTDKFRMGLSFENSQFNPNLVVEI